MIHVHQEPSTPMDQERCCFCRKKTDYWYILMGPACCPSCAKYARPEDVPTKAEWCRREHVAMHTEGAFDNVDCSSLGCRGF